MRIDTGVKIGFFALFCVIFIISGSMRGSAADDIEKQYKNSLNYYEKLKKKNADANDLIVVLDRIIGKYEPHGFDLSEIKAEKERVALLKEKLSDKKIPISDDVEIIDLNKYRIEIGDMLNIFVTPAEELTSNVVVQPDGKIALPLIGEVYAKGKTRNELSNDLMEKFGVYVANPEVSISIKKFSKRKVYLMGEVKRPGSYEYTDDIRLLELVSQSGGVTEKANYKDIKVYRGEGFNRKVFELNLDEVFKTGDFSKDFQLEPGDVIEIGKMGKDIYVIGEVRSTGSYAYRKGLRLLELITLAGGFTDEAIIQNVRVFRGDAPEIEVYEINMAKILDNNQFELDLDLMPGDTVYIPRQSFAKATRFVERLSPWLSIVNFGLMVALLITG